MIRSITIAILGIISQAILGFASDPVERFATDIQTSHLNLPRQYRIPHNTRKPQTAPSEKAPSEQADETSTRTSTPTSMNLDGNVTTASRQRSASGTMASFSQPVSVSSEQFRRTLPTSAAKPRKVRAAPVTHQLPATNELATQEIVPRITQNDYSNQIPISTFTQSNFSAACSTVSGGSFWNGSQYNFSYYFLPYQHTDIATQQNTPFVTSRSNPYDNRWFETIYEE
jgi:hypothetical protein